MRTLGLFVGAALFAVAAASVMLVVFALFATAGVTIRAARRPEE